MPAKALDLKPLYIAKTYEDLIRRAEDQKPFKPNSLVSVQNLIKNSMTKLYDEAKKAQITGDEERAYILFFRFFSTYKSIRDSKYYESEKTYHESMIGKKPLEVLESMELLSQSLTKRYAALKESQELRAKEIAESNETPVNGTDDSVAKNSSLSTKPNDESDKTYPVIDCQTLFEIIESATDLTRILIFDTRSAEEYNDSHIVMARTSADLNILNVPQDLLIPGLTVNKLDTLLPLGSVKDAFNRRRQMSKVIIVDRCSLELSQADSNGAFFLAQALWKWDVSSYKVRNKPFLLKGGYDEWVLTYPMYTSNPKYVSQTSKFTPNRKTVALSFNYDIDELEPKQPKKEDNHLANGMTNGEMETESSSDQSVASEQSSQLNHMFQSRPSKAAIPGTARPASNTPSIPDRSTKPKDTNANKTAVESNNKPNDDFEKFKLAKQNAINEEMMSYMKEEYDNTLQTLETNMKLKDQENAALKTTIRQMLPKKPAIDANKASPVVSNGVAKSGDKSNGITIDVSGDGDKENEENNGTPIRNSLSMNGQITNETEEKRVISGPKSINKSAGSLSVPSGLSRSLSSPNIAQLLAKQEAGNRHMSESMSDRIEAKDLLNPSQPAFDRSLKPSFTRVSFNDTKLRDFCPVHSAGNSITGLRNLGNTCFMNSVIQCLLNTTEFSNFFAKGVFHINKSSKFGSNGELVMELSALFRAMAYPSSYKSISPKDFKQGVSKHIQGFIGCAQQDSHEFLVMLIERLHADLNESTAKDVIDTSVTDDLSLSAAANKFWKDYMSKNKSIITQLFEGLIVQTLTCLTCRKSSMSFEVFRCLSLPLTSHRTSLNECLNNYFKTERLSGEAAWECPTCKTKREAEKKINIWKLPKVLIVHLKRFLYEGVWRQKMQTYVEFPTEALNVPTLTSDSRYTLYGVVNHYGTLEGGHYTAYSRNLSKYKWHRFDDQEVTQMNSADVKTQAAYILFYINT